MSEVKWIKLATNVFNNRKIKLIESMPDGDTIIVIWFKLLMLAGEINDEGNIYFTKELAYTDQMLATVFDRPIATIQLSLKTFEEFGMIEIVDNIIHVSNWEKYQNVAGLDRIKEQTRQRVSKHREKARLERQKDDVTLRNVTRNATVTQCNATDIEEDKDIDKDIPPLPPTGETWNFDKHTNVENAEHIVNEKVITPELADIIHTWMSYKDEKKPRATHHYVEKGITSLLVRFEKVYSEYGAAELNRVVEDSISNNYSGIVWDRLSKQKQTAEDKHQAWLDAWRNA
jgi:predicted phage replisome organizer